MGLHECPFRPGKELHHDSTLTGCPHLYNGGEDVRLPESQEAGRGAKQELCECYVSGTRVGPQGR